MQILEIDNLSDSANCLRVVGEKAHSRKVEQCLIP